MSLSREELHAFEIKNWQGKTLEEIILDSSSGTIEASKTPLSQRINPVAVKLDRFAKFVDKKSIDPVIIASTKIYEWAIEPSRKPIEIWLPSPEPRENEILETMSQMPDVNPQEIMIWISPKDQTFKEGSRIGIYQIISVNKEKYLFFRTLCSYDDAEKCARGAQNLLFFSSLKVNPITLLDPQILRATPLPISVPGHSLTNFLKKHLNMTQDVWETIAQGKDLVEKIRINKSVENLFTPEIIKEINQAQTFLQQAKIGSYIEQELQRRTGRILTAGSCGALYSTVFFSSSSLFFPLPPLASERGSERRHCGKCGKYGYFSEGESCPYSQTSSKD